MNMHTDKTNRQRFDWLDIAKAIAILLMIWGHMVKYNSPERNLIYSFHMPLFFIASGFTMHPVKDWKDFRKAAVADFRRIYLTGFLIQAVNAVPGFFKEWSYANIRDCILLRLEQFAWGSSFDIYGHPCCGLIWFMIGLFWCRIIFYLVQVLFQTPLNIVIYGALAILAQFLFLKQIWLPQSLDIAMFGTTLIVAGCLLRQHYELYLKYRRQITIVCFLIWLYLCNHGLRLDLGGRYYGNGAECIIGSVAGTLFVFGLSEALAANGLFAKVMGYIGKRTLWIYAVSVMDYILYPYWADFSQRMQYLVRPLITVAVALVLEAVFAMLLNLASVKTRRLHTDS